MHRKQFIYLLLPVSSVSGEMWRFVVHTLMKRENPERFRKRPKVVII